MYSCPHCSAPCYSLWRRVVEPWNSAISCAHCGGQVRRSDKAKLLEIVASQVLAAGLFLSLFLLPWWASTLLIVSTISGLLVLPDALFPPIAVEPFGSEADTKRAAFRFWLAAPAALIALVVVVEKIWG